MTTDKDVLRAITDLTACFGRPPTLRELADEFHMRAHSSVDYHLRKLRDQGRVQWEDGKARTLRVVDNNDVGKMQASPREAR